MVIAFTLAAAAVMFAVERYAPGRRWARVEGWWPRAILLNLVQVGVAFLAALTWDGWMAAQRPWDADQLGTAGGAMVGYLSITFLYYWWHRWRHSSAFLWRWIHQLHHSPSRIEIITSFYKHPLEILVNGVLSSAICYFLVGLGPAATVQAILLTGLAELFYHWNVRTPYWLGFIIQRPESHCVHHQRGLHHYNYGDLPLWDWMFGTLKNPRRWDAECGLGPDEVRIGALLRGEVLDG